MQECVHCVYLRRNEIMAVGILGGFSHTNFCFFKIIIAITKQPTHKSRWKMLFDTIFIYFFSREGCAYIQRGLGENCLLRARLSV